MKFIIYCFCLFIFYSCSKPEGKKGERSSVFIDKIKKKNYNPKQDISTLKGYVENNGYNEKYGILINYSIHSGKNRFFLCDLESEKVIIDGLVCHGSCGGNDKEFSNIEGSGCSSLGHYKIGNKYNGDFGTAYKLYGLDETNSNAYERFVVLHSHSCVPKQEVFYEICLSLGCPTLNPTVLKEIEPYLDKASKPIIIWGIK
jgi:hypothetical protein